jgi:hypothetical protein
LSVAFEQPKSSLPPARAGPLTAGKTIAAANIPLKSSLFIFASVHSERPIEPCSTEAMSPGYRQAAPCHHTRRGGARYRNPKDRELFLSGLRPAAGEAS